MNALNHYISLRFYSDGSVSLCEKKKTICVHRARHARKAGRAGLYEYVSH